MGYFPDLEDLGNCKTLERRINRMKINSNKCFIYNGRKYHVCALKVDWETLKALPYDAAGNKWYLTEVVGDREKVLYNNLGWNMAMFKNL